MKGVLSWIGLRFRMPALRHPLRDASGGTRMRVGHHLLAPIAALAGRVQLHRELLRRLREADRIDWNRACVDTQDEQDAGERSTIRNPRPPTGGTASSSISNGMLSWDFRSGQQEGEWGSVPVGQQVTLGARLTATLGLGPS